MDGCSLGYPFESIALRPLVRIAPMKEVYPVTLTDEHRARLRSLITAGQAAARTLTRARILLKADVCHEGGGCSDPEICQAVEVSRPTVERARKRFAQEGLEVALYPRPRLAAPSRRSNCSPEAPLLRPACTAPQPGAQPSRLL